MRSLFAVLAFVCATGLPFAASAQVGTEQLGRARIQLLKEKHKPYDIKTAQSLPPGGPAETNTAVFKREPSARPEIIAFPGYKGPSGPSR